MRTSYALLAGLAVALEGASAFRSSAVRARLVRSTAPSVVRVWALSAPRALPRMADASAGAELCDSEDPEEVCMLPMGVTVPMSWMNTAKVGLSFATWFFLNVMYNLTNKKCQNVFPMPWTMTVVSLFVGIPYVLFMWATGLRKAPKVSFEGYKKLFPIGVFHAAGHASAVIALGAGAVSFAQIVKAGEPVFTCLLSFLVLGQTFSPMVYATLLPIIGGVGLASLKELSFTWTVRRATPPRQPQLPPATAPRARACAKRGSAIACRLARASLARLLPSRARRPRPPALSPTRPPIHPSIHPRYSLLRRCTGARRRDDVQHRLRLACGLLQVADGQAGG